MGKIVRINPWQTLCVGENIKIRVLSIGTSAVRLDVQAPKSQGIYLVKGEENEHNDDLKD